MPVPSVPRSLFRAAAVALPLVLAAPVFVPRAAAEFDPVPRISHHPLPSPNETIHPGSLGPETRVIDLDGDGYLDMVDVIPPTGSGDGFISGVFWVRGQETHDLTTQQPFGERKQLTPLNLKQFEFVDVDGDGYPDLVGLYVSLQSWSDTRLVWLRNLRGETGEVSFETVPRSITGMNNSLVLRGVADMDGDGRPDVVAETGNAQLAIYLNPSNPSAQDLWTPMQPLPYYNQEGNSGTEFRYYGFRLADMDGDGDEDMVFITPSLHFPGKNDLIWMENALTNVSGYALELRTDVSVETDLPGSSTTAKLTVARIGGHWYFRFYAPGKAGVSFSETLPGLDPQKLAALKTLLDRTQAGTAPADSTRRLINQAAALFHYHTGPQGYTQHHLGENLYASSFFLDDLDGDGDPDALVQDDSNGSPTAVIYENRLDEDLHRDALERRRVDLSKVTVLLGEHLYDFDGDGKLGLACSSKIYGDLSVLEDIGGLMNGAEPHFRTITQMEGSLPSSGTSYYPNSFFPMDLDHDGDLDLVRSQSFAGQYLSIYENLGNSSRVPFLNAPVDLVNYRNDQKNLSDRKIRLVDLNGDGLPEISMNLYPTGQANFRNDLDKAPAFGFVEDATLPQAALPADNPAVDDPAGAAVLSSFAVWLGQQSWVPVNLRESYSWNIFRTAVDVDGDGDLDVVAFATDSMLNPRWLLWYENVTPAGGEPAFRGPHGISSGIWDDATLYHADVDGDGDMDIVTLRPAVRYDYSRWSVQAFLNRTAPPQDPVIAGITADPVVQASFTHSDFTAAMQTSDDLVNWDAAVAIPTQDLLNPAAMKAHLQWKDASRPQRFYRMLYTTAP